MVEGINEKVERFVENIRKSINFQCPAEIKAINEDGTVDVMVYRNEEMDNQYLPALKIIFPETNRAFFAFGLSVGDFGVVRFFDTNVEGYVDGKEEVLYARHHNNNDACFELGFVPNPSSFVYPTGSNMTFGNKDGSALVTIDKGGVINIIGGNIKIGGSSTVTIEGNVTIDGKNFLQHQHSNGNQGANTGAVV